MDDRGQAVVLGAVLLFGIVAVGYSIYQAEVIPNQNSEIEYQHFQQVRADLIAFQAAAVDTGLTQSGRSVDITLGTRYPARVAGINPPPAQGTLTTSKPYKLQINGESDGTVRLLRYKPQYSEFAPGTLRYEHGLLYLDPPKESGGIVPIESASLARSGTLQLFPLEGSYERSGTRSVTVTLYSSEIPDDRPIQTVTIPSRINESQWEELLGANQDVPYITQVDGPNTGVNNIQFDIGSRFTDAKIFSVGIGQNSNNTSVLESQRPLNPPSDLRASRFVAFADANDNSNLKLIDPGGDVTDLRTNQIKAAGPPIEGFDGDGDIDTPYISNNDELTIADTTGRTSTLVPNWNGKQARLGAGDWNNDGTIEVLYIKNNNKIGEVTQDGALSSLPGNAKAASIAGVGDFDSDQADELVYVSTDDELRYLESSSGNSVNNKDSGVTVSSSNAIGRPADYDDDANLEVPVVQGDNIILYEENGSSQTVDPGVDLKQSPMGAFDATEDGITDIVFVGNVNNQRIRYVTATGQQGILNSSLKANGNVGAN